MYDEWERPGSIWACWTHENVFYYFLEKIVRRKTDFQKKKEKNYSKVATKVAHFCFSFVTKSEIWIFKKFFKWKKNSFPTVGFLQKMQGELKWFKKTQFHSQEAYSPSYGHFMDPSNLVLVLNFDQF